MRDVTTGLELSADPHPTSLREATFSHEWEKDSRAEFGLKRVGVFFASADAHGALHLRDENLAVANVAGARDLGDGGDAGVGDCVRHDEFDLHLGQEGHDIFGAAINLGMTLLASEALDLGGGHAEHADLVQRLAHFVELEGFYDGADQLHAMLCLPDRQKGVFVSNLRAKAMKK